MNIWIVLEYWDETNGYKILDIYPNPGDAVKKENEENSDRRFIQTWSKENRKWKKIWDNRYEGGKP